MTEFRLILSGDAISGKIKINRVAFEGGVFGDDGSADYAFMTDEKPDYDTDFTAV